MTFFCMMGMSVFYSERFSNMDWFLRQRIGEELKEHKNIFMFLEKRRTSDYVFTLVNNGIRFFFITLMFGYFADHMHQRKFRS